MLGVGELSAINAVAGSSAEKVPVVHVVGLPRRDLIESDALVHHSPGLSTLYSRRGKLDNLLFRRMHKHITDTGFNPLSRDEEKIVRSIDETISNAIKYRIPSYLPLPSDMVAQQIDETHLDRPLLGRGDDPKHLTNEAVEKILHLLYWARNPLLLVDRAGMDHPNMRKLLNEFVRYSGIPTLTMPSGASMIDHKITNYYGVHAGPVGQIDTMPYVNGCDLVLAFGPMFSDTQTLGWSVVPPETKTITVAEDHVKFFGEKDGTISISLEMLLKTMTESLDTARLAKPDTTSLGDFRKISPPPVKNLDEPVDQTSFYLRLNSYLRPHDIILLGNATPILGGRDFVLPDSSCRVIASGLWFSIGHMLPAALGAAMAQQRSPKSSDDAKRGRVILIEGDGSFQVTAQELSTIIHQRLNVTILIINNEGYAYERLIHNQDEDYHDVAPWDYNRLPDFFGAAKAKQKAKVLGEKYSVHTWKIRTWRDLNAFLTSEKFDNGFDGRGMPGLKLVNVQMAKTDVPEKFKAVFESAGKNLD